MTTDSTNAPRLRMRPHAEAAGAGRAGGARPARRRGPRAGLLPAALATAAVLLAACSSSPRVQFHSLMPVDAPAAPARAPAFAFRIESPVRVPAQVDQPQMVLRTAAGEVRVQEYHRWVAPLADEWRDAVADQIARRAGAQDASRVPAMPGLARWDLRLELQRFDAVPGGQVLQQAAWSVSSPMKPGTLLSCTTTVTGPAPPEVSGVAASQRAATRQLADTLATALLALHAGSAPACP